MCISNLKICSVTFKGSNNVWNKKEKQASVLKHKNKKITLKVNKKLIRSLREYEYSTNWKTEKYSMLIFPPKYTHNDWHLNLGYVYDINTYQN